MKKRIRFMDTSFRDGFQSVFGARVFTDDFIPAVEAAAHAGIKYFEAGGGARFQAPFMYCGESAFDMMDRFRKAAGRDAQLQTLARGINVVALSAQPRDMIELHATTFQNHGITHIRNFDALNDVRNLVYSGQCIKNAGLHHQAAITMMELPPGCQGAHDPAFYLKILREILDSGPPFDSICFKDASGTSNPHKVYETIKGARSLLGDEVLIWVHSHDTAGIGLLQYHAAVEAGCDGLCLARPPLSGGTCQPDLLSFWHGLKGTNYILDIDVKKIMEANAVFQECMNDYYFPPEAHKISPEIIMSPMPGGALTANTMMMRDTGTLHLYPKVIEAMSECVSRGGFGTSVTPVSQFYFQQAYVNVTEGPWKKITEGYGNMVLGYFGRTPVPPDPEIVKLAEEQLGKPFFKGDPLDTIEAGVPKAKTLLAKENLPITPENLFIVGALQTPGGNKGLDFLKGEFQVNVRKKTEMPKAEPKAVSPLPDRGDHKEEPIENYIITVEGNSYNVSVEKSGGQRIKPRSNSKEISIRRRTIEVLAQTPGNVTQIMVSVGDTVKKGEPLIILEAMKMETPVVAPVNGVVDSLEVEKGQVVRSGQLIAILS